MPDVLSLHGIVQRATAAQLEFSNFCDDIDSQIFAVPHETRRFASSSPSCPQCDATTQFTELPFLSLICSDITVAYDEMYGCCVLVQCMPFTRSLRLQKWGHPIVPNLERGSRRMSVRLISVV